jgi:hypothetical protein
MTRAMQRALELLALGPMPLTGPSIFRIQQRTMDALCDAGLARWQPYAKEPCWRITAAGRTQTGRPER